MGLGDTGNTLRLEFFRVHHTVPQRTDFNAAIWLGCLGGPMQIFRVGDKVHKIGDWKNAYTVVAVGKRKPRYQIQLGTRTATWKWVVSEDLENEPPIRTSHA
jgi:hypothetical protein